MKPVPARKRILAPLLLAAVTAACAAATALAHSSLAPENVSTPHVSGIEAEGSMLTADKGLWANTPTSFVYKWQRCDTDGSACSRDIQTGSKNTYILTAADVQHSIRVVVTGVNGDGRGDTVPSEATRVISSKAGPKNSTAPAISGEATVGQQLTVSPGSWTPTPTSYTYYWQRCDSPNTNCRNVARATTYTLRSPDVGTVFRALVIAKATAGSTSVYTGHTPYVQSNTPPPKVNQAPTLRFDSLIRLGRRVYARFQVCDDGIGRITVVERDTKAGKLAYTRRYSVYTYASCGTFSRSWTPAPRFRTSGRMTVTLQAVDKSHRTSALRSKSVYRSR